MASNMHVFDPAGDMTFILQSMVLKEPRKSSSLLSYRSSTRKFAKVYMRVSSKRLMMASPVFKAMLKHCFMEGITLRATGKVEVPLPDDDPVAFALLMDIIHGTRGRAPPQMDTLFLTTLAILVDKYRLQLCIATSSDVWVDSLRHEIPQTLTPDLLHWLCISWVFRRPIEFNMVTRIAERESLGQDLDTYSQALNANLPIPQRVIESILSRRIKAIRNCFDIIGRYIDMLQLSAPRCTSSRNESHRYTCNNVLLGSLLESSTSLGLWPPADLPYRDLNFKFVAHEVMQIKVVSFCSKMGFTNQPSGSHGVKAEIGAAIGKVKTRFSGLHLKDFD
ncbi:hypothetical protein ONS95_003068 [Cadophora gregata]|uniref:uncharacterized protein n=1 Tax=Cadophora gregata TaxID=51156 RepID=UPI0026DD9237|nr:uncharacterized protein ONS95_003068 [Cadophora gregata]KAK0108250.1 hypothetical protein ONS95_003068 [Cadophora gregata]KAK0109159.1 hypothetical protein ONS96_002983 [Cadophora gregata f. sp. sojae]